MNKQIPEELKLLDEWQKRLGLHDWFITLKTDCKPEELSPDEDGDVEYVESTQCAIIRVIDQKLRKDALRPFDFEEILVHELLHCRLSLLLDGDNWDTGFQPRYLHQIVDRLSRAFVDAKRSNKDE